MEFECAHTSVARAKNHVNKYLGPPYVITFNDYWAAIALLRCAIKTLQCVIVLEDINWKSKRGPE
jgi:hypothetical protein